MSSVESILPMFGVSSVVFHGSGLPYIGRPVMICCAGAAADRREEDHVVLGR